MMRRVIRYQPLSELSPYGERVTHRPAPQEPRVAALALDVFRTEETLVVEAAVPGMSPEDIEVRVVGESLTISGEVKAEETVEGKQYVFQERRTGRFSRMLTLPDDVDTDQATAEFENGVLRLEFPKREEVKPKQIKVSVRES